MQIQLSPYEPVTEGIQRIALELNTHAVAALKNASGKEHEAIHAVRKDLKQMRSLLRLIRESARNETYRRENLFYRNSGREISGIRDATSMIEALDKLNTAFKGEIREDIYLKLKEQLVRKRDAMTDDLVQVQHLLPQLRERLEQANGRIAGWTIPDLRFAAVKPGFRRVYERGYELMAKAEREPLSPNLHEWRKQAKYLMHHTRVFTPLWPEILGPLALEINLLTDHLGDHHDLSLLDRESRTILKDEKENNVFETLVRERMKSLRQLAFLLGRKIYALDPYSCADQLEAWWRSWMEKNNAHTATSGK